MIRSRLRSAWWQIIDAASHPNPGVELWNRQGGKFPVTEGIVFSHDRPMQLDALLRSYHLNVPEPARLSILYRCSSDRFARAYEELVATHSSGDVRFVSEADFGGFASALRRMVQELSCPTVFFLVDDILFIRPFNIHAFAQLASSSVIPSMRLGRNIKYSYTRRSRQRQPVLISVALADHGHWKESTGDSDRLLMWKWRSGLIDWGYPFSLDGNIFTSAWIQAVIDQIGFSGPNSLESALDSEGKGFWPRWGISFAESRIVNSPINRVQSEVENFSGNTSPEYLLLMWNQGFRMDIRELNWQTPASVHQEMNLPLTRLT